MDAYGHVNNARFLTLYEEARVAMFFVGARSHGPRRASRPGGRILPGASAVGTLISRG